MNGEEKTNFPCRKITNNLCEYLTLSGGPGSITPTPSSIGYTVLSSQEDSLEKREGETNFTVETPDKHCFSQAVNVNNNIINHVDGMYR